jgi:superfamily I DNA/RNA helicase
VDTLNSQQKQAAQAGDGPVIIIAGPGTGKTKTLTARLGFLVAHGVAPSKILALTFTKKAAEEMRQRFAHSSNTAGPAPQYPHKNFMTSKKSFAGSPLGVTPGFASSVGSHNSEAVISTFHALCFNLLTEKLGKAPQIIAEPARLALIKNLPKPAELKNTSTRELSLLISRAKNMADSSPAVHKIVAGYNRELAAQDLCDFDDILLRVNDLLQQDTSWRAALQARFAHILVDEFQDTNALQYQLLQHMRGTNNIFVIGDPQQSIYGFRGADGDIFAKFRQDFPNAMNITLSINYRSASQVVALANALYPDMPPLTAHSKITGQVRAVEVLNEYSEANWVLAEIQKIIGGSDMQRAVSDDGRQLRHALGDIAVLYRSRTVARTMQKILADSGIPVQVVGEGSPYDAPSVQIILQLLTNLVDASRPAIIKGLTTRHIAALLQKLNTAQPPLHIAEHIMEICKLEPNNAIRQLLTALVQHKTLADAVAYFDQLATQNFYDPRADAVTLLTIHASKGLEFAHVFLVGAEEGVLPSERGEPAEEKRLFYVAATRAKERLDVLHTKMRGGQKATMSQFITECAPSVLPRMIDAALVTDQRRAQKRKAKRSQTSLF